MTPAAGTARAVAAGACICGRSLPCPHASEHGVAPIIVVVAFSAVVAALQTFGGDTFKDVVKGALDIFFGFVADIASGVVDLAGHAVALLPDASDLDIHVPSGFIMGYSFMNGILPLDAGLQIAGIMFGIWATVFTWRVALTVWHLVPKPLMGT